MKNGLIKEGVRFFVSQEFSSYISYSSCYIGLIGAELGINKSINQRQLLVFSE